MIAKRRPSGLAPPSWISRFPQNYSEQPKLLRSVSAMVTSNLVISNRPHQNIPIRTSQKVTTLYGICSNIKKVIQVQSRRGPNLPLPRPDLDFFFRSSWS